MGLFFRRLGFFFRWVIVYNVRLIWLSGLLPKSLPAKADFGPEVEALRRQAQVVLGEATKGCSAVCGKCGRCCLETVDRFTPFDQIVRLQTGTPAPSGDRRIYSVPWMVWNAVSHGVGRAIGKSNHGEGSCCRYLEPDGCTLAREERPMLCTSWFCNKMAFAMDTHALDTLPAPLTLIESLHQDAVRVARGGEPRAR